MIKIAMVTNHFGITGISTVILNYAKVLNHEKYDITVIAGEPIAEENRIICSKNGIKLIVLPSRRQETLRHYILLWNKLRKNKYDIVHVHGSSSIMAVELTIAILAGSKIRIAHSHNSFCNNMRLQKLLNPYFRKTYTKALSCGMLAGDWLFGAGKFEILPNGLYGENFIFDSHGRDRIRKDLHIENKYVIGHIGRFNKQKNQSYLLKVFEKIAEKRKDAVLILVGDGPDFEEIESLVDIHPYKDKIILYGVTKDLKAIYSAMDVFVLPSKYEGFPVVLLEAQISGLPCVASDKVTKEVDFGNIYWASIDEAPEIYAEKILKTNFAGIHDREEFYNTNKEKIEKYDIRTTVKQLENIYTKLLEAR